MKSIFSKTNVLLLSFFLIISCQEDSKDYILVGKNAVIIYPDFEAEVHYLSDSTLHWKTTSNNGNISEGTEKIFLKKIGNSQYFINWVEKNGLTISQVIDMKTKEVTAFATFDEENNSQNKRGSAIIEGKFILNK